MQQSKALEMMLRQNKDYWTKKVADDPSRQDYKIELERAEKNLKEYIFKTNNLENPFKSFFNF
jgi:hypothetical protein